MKSGLKEPLGFSEIDFDAANASSFDLPTTNVSKRYRGLKTEKGSSTVGGGGPADVIPSLGDSASGTRWMLIRSREISSRVARLSCPYRSRISWTNWEEVPW